MLNSSDILRGYTDTIILAQLAGGDSYGYVISKNVQEDHPRRITAERSDPVYDIQAAGNGRHD